ncbi:MAG: DoxX family protein [Gemmataceae bacterium]
MEPEPRWLTASDFGKLILRLGVGGLMLIHGIAKIQGGIDPIVQAVKAHGLPDQLAYGVYAGEVAAPALIILGLLTRLGGLLVAGNMAFAVYLAHLDQLGVVVDGGGWALELQGLYFAGGLALLFLGAGKIGLAAGKAPWD